MVFLRTTSDTQTLLKRKYQSYIMFDLQLVSFKLYKLHVKTK